MDPSAQNPTISAADQTQTLPAWPQQTPASSQAADTTVPAPSVPPVLAQPVTHVASMQPQPQVGVPARAKEMGAVPQEVVGFVEVVGSDSVEKEPLPPEVASWMEKVNRGEVGGKPPEIVIADKTAHTPSYAGTAQPVYVLPLGRTEFRAGLHKSVSDSVRWLAEWCKRVMKKMGSQAMYPAN